MVKKIIAMKLPILSKDNNGNYSIENKIIEVNKNIDNESTIKNLVGEVCMDLCKITSGKGMNVTPDAIIDDLPTNEVLILSFNQFIIQYKFIEYLKQKNIKLIYNYEEKIKNLESVLSQERVYNANIRDELTNIDNMLKNQISLLPVKKNNIIAYEPTDKKRKLELNMY